MSKTLLIIIIIGEDTKVVCILESEVELDKEGVVDGCQHFLLPTDVLDLLLLDDVSFVQNLHCSV